MFFFVRMRYFIVVMKEIIFSIVITDQADCCGIPLFVFVDVAIVIVQVKILLGKVFVFVSLVKVYSGFVLFCYSYCHVVKQHVAGEQP